MARKEGMLKTIKWLLMAAILLMSSTAAAGRGSIVYYQESESGIEPYATRLIVTADFLRFDDGVDGNDFLLFDRKQEKIYTTNSTDKRILVIHGKQAKLPAAPRWTHRVETDDEQVPAIGAAAVKHLLLTTNNVVCYDLYAAQGLLPDVVKALGEYRRALAVQQAEILSFSKGIERSPCELSNNIYLPDRHLQHGFPVRIRDMDGRAKLLVNYRENAELNEQLFILPKGYKEFTVTEMYR